MHDLLAQFSSYFDRLILSEAAAKRGEDRDASLVFLRASLVKALGDQRRHAEASREQGESDPP